MRSYTELLFTVLLWSLTKPIMNLEVTSKERAVAGGINRFSAKLYKALVGDSGNLVVSPFSVDAVVAMLNLGLGGDTQKEVTQALYLPETRSDWAEGFRSIFSSLQATENVTLEIANKIYVQTGFNVKQEFKNDTSHYFNSETEEVDIAGSPDGVVAAVNGWAEEKTHDKIKDLLAPGSLSGDIVMILLNAIYFKGLWKTQFKKEDTSDMPFYLDADSQKDVAMMSLHTDLPYTELHDVQILKLPYQGEKFSMLIFLPRQIDGLSKLESQIEQLDVPQIMKNMYTTEVDVKLPKFKILKTIDLNGPLTKIGFQNLFSDGANFSGISDHGMFISKALQKAFIEVNEEGTEAAAVTALFATIISVGLPTFPKSFHVDRPFLAMIVEEEKATILFMARVVNPEV